MESIDHMKDIVILGKTTCGPCNEAKALLEREGLPYSFLNVDQQFDLKNFIVAAGFKTVPQIFIDGKHIGGKDDLVALFSNYPGVDV